MQNGRCGRIQTSTATFPNSCWHWRRLSSTLSSAIHLQTNMPLFSIRTNSNITELYIPVHSNYSRTGWVSFLISITENETAPPSSGTTTSESLPQSHSTSERSPANPDILYSCHESAPYRSDISQPRLAGA